MSKKCIKRPDLVRLSKIAAVNEELSNISDSSTIGIEHNRWLTISYKHSGKDWDDFMRFCLQLHKLEENTPLLFALLFIVSDLLVFTQRCRRRSNSLMHVKWAAWSRPHMCVWSLTFPLVIAVIKLPYPALPSVCVCSWFRGSLSSALGVRLHENISKNSLFYMCLHQPLILTQPRGEKKPTLR